VTALTDGVDLACVTEAAGSDPQIGRSVIRVSRAHQHKDQDFLGQPALALERARLLADLRERNDALAALGEIARAVSASLEVETTLRAVSAYAAQLTHSDSASLFLYDEARDRSEVCASHNTPEEYLKAIESHQGARLTGATQEPTFGLSLVAKVVRERAPAQIPDAEAATQEPNRDLVSRWVSAFLSPRSPRSLVVGALCAAAGAGGSSAAESAGDTLRQAAAIVNAPLQRIRKGIMAGGGVPPQISRQHVSRASDAAERHRRVSASWTRTWSVPPEEQRVLDNIPRPGTCFASSTISWI
jgi:GAF domain-containing protein